MSIVNQVLAFSALHGHLRNKIEKIKKIPELAENHKAYDENFEKLLSAVNTPHFTKYSKEEKRLHLLDLKIRDKYRVLTP